MIKIKDLIVHLQNMDPEESVNFNYSTLTHVDENKTDKWLAIFSIYLDKSFVKNMEKFDES